MTPDTAKKILLGKLLSEKDEIFLKKEIKTYHGLDRNDRARYKRALLSAIEAYKKHAENLSQEPLQ